MTLFQWLCRDRCGGGSRNLSELTVRALETALILTPEILW
jgi:hypothetical protein